MWNKATHKETSSTGKSDEGVIHFLLTRYFVNLTLILNGIKGNKYVFKTQRIWVFPINNWIIWHVYSVSILSFVII